MKTIKHFFVLILFFFIVSCSSEKKEWENTKQVNTILAYEDYINAYPKAVYSDSALLFIENIRYNNAVDTNTIAAYNNYLSKYPTGQFSSQAQEKLIDIEWENTKTLNSLKSYKEFISKYPESKFVESANNEISKIELIKKCPFSLIKDKSIGLQHYRYGDSYTIELKGGKIVSLTCDKWLIQGLDGKLLEVEQIVSGSPLSDNFSITTLWIDQPFKISYNGKVIVSKITTDEYNKILKP